MSLREQMLGADDLARVTVDVPEWGMDVTVRGLTAGEVEEFGRAFNNGKAENVMARLVVKVVVDDEGARVLSDEDVEALSGKNSGVIKRLFDAAQKASGLEEDHAGN